MSTRETKPTQRRRLFVEAGKPGVVGPLLAGFVADALGSGTAIALVAALTGASGLLGGDDAVAAACPGGLRLRR